MAVTAHLKLKAVLVDDDLAHDVMDTSQSLIIASLSNSSKNIGVLRKSPTTYVTRTFSLSVMKPSIFIFGMTNPTGAPSTPIFERHRKSAGKDTKPMIVEEDSRANAISLSALLSLKTALKRATGESIPFLAKALKIALSPSLSE